MRTEIKAALVMGLFGILCAVIWGINSGRDQRSSSAPCDACGGTGRVQLEAAG